MDLIAMPGGTLQGQTTIPGDKSISHRALIISAIAEGETLIEGFLEGEDCLATLKSLQALGVKITRVDNTTLKVQGVGLKGLTPAAHPLDCGNSGTTMRLLAGVLAGQPFTSTLIGDPSLMKRPMGRIVHPLRQMGADIHGVSVLDEIYPPLTINGKIEGYPLKAISYTLPVASAQVKSCLLLAGLFAQGKTTITEPIPTRDHTEKMLKRFGRPLKAHSISVPGDISSSAFFITGASFTKGAHLILQNIGINPRRTGFINILREMGADIVFHDEREVGGEKRADIEVKGRPLEGIKVSPEWAANAIDEFPILFIAACAAKGTTEIHGIKELRYKESDRLAVMARGLRSLGVALEELPEGICITGSSLKGGFVDSADDHRVGMAFAIGSLLANGPIHIENCDNIATSFPNFQSLANQLGLTIKVSLGV